MRWIVVSGNLQAFQFRSEYAMNRTTLTRAILATTLLSLSLSAAAAQKLVATLSMDDFQVGGTETVDFTAQFDTDEAISGIGLTGLWSAVVADNENGTAPWSLDLEVTVTAPDGSELTWNPIGGDVTIADYPLQDFRDGFSDVANEGEFEWSFSSVGPPWVAGMSDVQFHLTTQVPEVEQVFEGSVAEGPLWERPYFIAGISGQGPVIYSAMEFEVTVSGGYDIESVVPSGNNFAYIYQGGFDPEQPLENLLDYGLGNGFGWDGSPQGTSRISAMLFEGETYHLVVSQWSPGNTGQPYTNTVTGPGEFNIIDHDEIFSDRFSEQTEIDETTE